MPVLNAEIAAMFDQTAELLEIDGANPFRVRAYRRAARVIDALPQSVESMLAAGKDLSELPGIGKDLAGKIAEIVRTAKFPLLESLKRKLPGDLVEIAGIPGLGPKRVKLLFTRARVRTLEDLRRAARSGRLRRLEGFGPKVEQNILAALAKRVGTEKRTKLSVAEGEADAFVRYLQAGSPRWRVVAAGSFRRRRETVGDLDFLVTASNARAVADRFVGYENVAEVRTHGPERATVILRSGLQADLRVVHDASYGAALLYFTGSKPHNIALRGVANEHDWKLNEYGLFAGNRRIAGATEEDVYRKLGLDFVPPELREDRGEIDRARARRLPRLITLADIRGDLHTHTKWTDGNATVAEMAGAAKARGYEYLAVTDHSRKVTVAHGLDPRQLSRQLDEIDRVNDKLDHFVVLKGIELDILPDGRLDLPDMILSRLDIVVAAVHSGFDLPREKQTARVIRAMDSRRVSIIAHPTGRLIGERDPYEIDIERIIEAARERGCHLELNAQPDRLDLNEVHARAAKEAGVKLAISSDAHSTATLDWVRFGIDQARRGWIEPDDVINTRPLAALRKSLKR